MASGSPASCRLRRRITISGRGRAHTMVIPSSLVRLGRLRRTSSVAYASALLTDSTMADGRPLRSVSPAQRVAGGPFPAGASAPRCASPSSLPGGESVLSPSCARSGWALCGFLSSRVLFPVVFLSPSLVAAAVGAFPRPAMVARWAFSGSRFAGASASVAFGVAGSLGCCSSSACPGWVCSASCGASGPSVAVGCAAGCDRSVRSALASWPGLSVFRSAGRSPGALAARSAACVRSVLPAVGGCLVVLPSGPCPSGVSSCLSFRGFGSGSWGSVGLGLGLGLPVVVFVPPGLRARGFAGPVAHRFSVASSGPWGAWLLAAAVAPAPSLFGS